MKAINQAAMHSGGHSEINQNYTLLLPKPFPEQAYASPFPNRVAQNMVCRPPSDGENYRLMCERRNTSRSQKKSAAGRAPFATRVPKQRPHSLITNRSRLACSAQMPNSPSFFEDVLRNGSKDFILRITVWITHYREGPPKVNRRVGEGGGRPQPISILHTLHVALDSLEGSWGRLRTYHLCP